MGRNIKCYAPSNNIDIPSQIIGQSGKILNYYSDTLGSYPYPDFKVAFVPMKGFHGMEYSGLIFLREEFLNPNYDKQKREFILAHEIAHQWCYAMVGNDQLREPWLDEGLANWLANKYLQKYGDYSQPDINYQQGVKLSKQLKEMRSNREYYRTAYEGGEAFWYGLEQELGEETVINVLRSYLAEYRYKIASSQDLLAIIEKEAHKDMDYYFNKWF
jgi:aminopeptidase N